MKRILLSVFFATATIMSAAIAFAEEQKVDTGDKPVEEAVVTDTMAPVLGTPDDKDIKIGFIVKNPEESWFFQREWEFADRFAKEKGIKLVKIGAPTGEQALSAIDTLDAMNAQGLIICTPDVKLGPTIKSKADGVGMKLITVDDRFVMPDGHIMKDVPYVGIAAKDIGTIVGKALAEEMKKRGWSVADTGLLAVTFKELGTARDRVDGAENAIVGELKFPVTQIYEAPQKAPDTPSGMEAANIILTKNQNVKHWLVCGMNDETVVGAVRALEGRKYSPNDIIAIGINGDETAINEFRKDKPTGFYASILLSAKKHGYMTTKMMYDWIKYNKQPDRETYTEGVLINRDNYKQMLKEQGITD